MIDELGDQDRRAHPRVDVSTSAVVLVRSNAGVNATIDSISLGGARLTGQFALDPTERIQILFEFEGDLVWVTGDVIRVEARDLFCDRVAVRFVDLAGEARELVRKLVLQTLELVDDSSSASNDGGSP